MRCRRAARPLGHATRPRDEPVRLGQQPSLAFAASMLAGVSDDGSSMPPRIAIHGFGLFGPNGPLPTHLTEYAHERAAQHDDPTFAAFADLFHHRLILLFYRLGRRAADGEPRSPGTRTVRRLCREPDRPGDAGRQAGRESRHPRRRRHARAACALFPRGPSRAAHAQPGRAVQILRRHFGVEARIVEHVPQWVAIERSQRCTIRATRPTLRVGAVALGAAVRDAQSRFRIVLGPLSLDAYRRFLPGGPHARQLTQWVREYVGIEFDWDVQLELAADAVPAIALGAPRASAAPRGSGNGSTPAPRATSSSATTCGAAAHPFIAKPPKREPSCPISAAPTCSES